MVFPYQFNQAAQRATITSNVFAYLLQLDQLFNGVRLTVVIVSVILLPWGRLQGLAMFGVILGCQPQLNLLLCLPAGSTM